MPMPSPGIHLAVSRQRLGQINEGDRNRTLADAITDGVERVKAKNAVGEKIRCLCISELSLLPLMAARLGVDEVRIGLDIYCWNI